MKPSRSAILVSLVVVAAVRAQPVAWPVSQGGNGHLYEVVIAPSGAITWPAAEQAALSAGGHLATLTSQAEEAFVFGLANNPQFFPTSFGPWIGGFQPAGSAEPAGGWQWVTMESFSFVNWGPNEPNNAGCVSDENGLHLRMSGWNDQNQTSCQLPNSYVVEWPVTLPPQYQTNFSFASSLDVNGVQGTSSVPATVTVSIGVTATLGLASVNLGQQWNLGTGSAPLISTSAGALVTSDGQIVNLDLTDPTFDLWFAFLQGPAWGPSTAVSIPFSIPSATTVSAQMIVVDPGLMSGIALSQPVRLIVQ